MLAVHSQNSLRNNDLFMWRGEAATLAHVWPQMRQFTNLMFSGLLGRLPDLKIAFLEAGCGWVPYLMSKMGARMGEALPPAKLIERGQIYFQCGEEMTTGRDVELLGDECLFWASDFPHEGIVRHEQGGGRVLAPGRSCRGHETQDQLRQSEKALQTLKIGSKVPMIQLFQMVEIPSMLRR